MIYKIYLVLAVFSKVVTTKNPIVKLENEKPKFDVCPGWLYIIGKKCWYSKNWLSGSLDAILINLLYIGQSTCDYYKIYAGVFNVST